MDRVRIGTCSGPAEAALVRAAFEAHGIPIVINAEQHASMLGGLGGAFVPLHIFVREDRAEEAAALLQDLREHAGEAAEGEAEAAEGELDGGGRANAVEDQAEDDASDGAPIEVTVQRRRSSLVAMMLGFCVSFGTAHLLTGAPLRALALAGVEALAIRFLIEGQHGLGSFLLVACIVTDVTGALWRIHKSGPEIPIARVRR